MNRAWRVLVLGSLLVATGCGSPEPVPAAKPTEAPPTVEPSPTPEPARPEDAADAFFTAWQRGQYAAMYELLAADAKAATPREIFVRRYTNIHDGIGETSVTVQATPPPPLPDPAATQTQVPFQVTRGTAIYGDLSENN